MTGGVFGESFLFGGGRGFWRGAFVFVSCFGLLV